MREVAIIGAGELGGLVAHVLARRDVARSIRLIDETGRVAEGKALDIQQAAPVEGFATQMIGGTDVASAAGASVIVVADRVGGEEWRGDDALQLVRGLSRLSPRAVILCAGASQRDVIERAVTEWRLPRTRLLGSAPEALAAAARALVALGANGSPRDVALTVLGVPPAHTIIPWEEATIAGVAIARVIDEPVRRRAAARIAALWPPGPYALASAAAAAIDAIAGRSRQIVSCFVGPDTASGTRARAAALPTRLGAAGIVDVVTPALSGADRVALDNAMNL